MRGKTERREKEQWRKKEKLRRDDGEERIND